MARDIKFRAWDKANAEMVRFEDIYIELEDGCLSVFKFVRNGNGLPDRHELDTYEGNVVMLQYTGLRDKDGTEIYESDIVQWNGINYAVCIGEFGVRDIETESVTDIVFGVYGDPINEAVEPFCFQMQLNASWIAQYGIGVIGNIYENPELLKA